MSRFDDITLTWEGKTYAIPANRVFGAIARIEEHILLAELSEASSGKIPLVKAARAWVALLDYAGCKGVDAEAVYAGMFGRGEATQDILMGFKLLELIMIPPEHLREPVAEGEPGKVQPIDEASPKNASVQRSGKTGARKKTSGRSRR